MNQIKALLRTTWWLWLLFFGASIALYATVDPVFITSIPICVFTLLYFAFVRFDENGDRRE